MTRTTTLNHSAEAGRKSARFPLIAGGAVLVAALVVAILAAKPGANSTPSVEAPPAPVASTEVIRSLEATERHFDFGSISMAAGKVSHRFWFRNEGAQAVMLERIHTSCMCTTATLVKGMRIVGTYGMAGHGPLPAVNQTLAPGEAAYIDAVFDPAAHGPAGLGRTERVILIERAGGAPLRLAFSADVRP
jgi:hypothetical protein